jgi:integrase
MASIHMRTIHWETKDGLERTGRRYQARYRDRAGQEHARLFKLKRDAQRWLNEQTAGIVTGQWADPRAGKQTLKTYAEQWRARQVHADTTELQVESILRNHVFPAIGGMRLDSISPADVQALVKSWSVTAAPSTVENRYLILAIVLRAAVRDRMIPASPCVDIKLPRIAPKSALVPITTETVLALWEAMADRYKVFVTLAAGTGMRRGELLGLTLDRVSQDFGTIRVDRQMSRKATAEQVIFVEPKTAASTRTIQVADVVLDAITKHVDTFGAHQTGLILTSEIGTPLRTSTLHRAWTIATRKVGTDATPHDLRHYFASMQIAGGTSIKKLQALLGHKSAMETWDTYGHLMGDEDDRSRSVIQGALTPLAISADSTRTVDPR